MTPHIHHWEIEEKGNALIYTCTTAGCRRRRIVEEFDLPDEYRPPHPMCTHDAEFSGEANSLHNIFNAVLIAACIIGAVMLITWFITDHFWPIGG